MRSLPARAEHKVPDTIPMRDGAADAGLLREPEKTLLKSTN
jgi:hypothetical protein